MGHSMGNLEIINYINDNVIDKSFPQVAHLVAIAGYYNGLVGQSETQNAKINPKTGELEKWTLPTANYLVYGRPFRKIQPC